MKSVVGMVLSIVGAIFNLCLTLITGLFFVLVYFFGRKTFIEYNLSEELIDFASVLSFWLLVLAIIFLLTGILGIVGSSMMNRERYVKKGGVVCLIVGVLSLNLFMIIGGVMGIFLGRNNKSNVIVNY